jgi:hypothetical protein
MKQKHLYLIGFIAILGIISCAKERGPRLTILVQEKDGTPAVGASVHAWPGNDPQNGGSGIVNEADMDQTATTDATGNAVFDFKFSAVLDVDVIYYRESLDSLLNPVTDTLTGSRVVKIESKRQRDEENNFYETVEVQ